MVVTAPVAQMRLRFGEFELDPDLGCLSHAGTSVTLQEQSLRLLVALVSSPGVIITREELRADLWPGGIHVDFEHGLNTAVRRLREALGDTAGTPRFIETLPRRGYRFIAPVEPARDGTRCTTVAVLPFLNLNGDSEAGYLADGIMEDLLTELSRLRGLKVVSRTSSMHLGNRDLSIPEIARELHADVLIEGSVRHEGRRVRIAVRVIDGRNDTQLWADSYERELKEILAIQRTVAQQVASALPPSLAARERENVAPDRGLSEGTAGD